MSVGITRSTTTTITRYIESKTVVKKQQKFVVCLCIIRNTNTWEMNRGRDG